MKFRSPRTPGRSDPLYESTPTAPPKRGFSTASKNNGGSQDLATPGEGKGAGARQGTQTPEIQTASELEDLEATKQDRQHPGQNSGQVIIAPRGALRWLPRSHLSVRRSERHYHPKSASRHS